MANTPGSKFDIQIYESPCDQNSCVNSFAGGTASHFALSENGHLPYRDDVVSREQTPRKTPNQPCDLPSEKRISHKLNTRMTDPKASHSDLKLSGRLISASVCVRQALGFDRSQAWKLSTRKGTSALFDHFVNLSSAESSWSHTLVAWTGEIASTGNVSKVLARPRRPDMMKSQPSLINPSSSSFPLRSSFRTLPDAEKGVILSSGDRKALEHQLLNDHPVRTVPVWLYDESEEGKDTIVFTDQSRWRRYAEHELYPTLHYRLNPPTDGSREKKWWTDFVRMNQKFADRIMSIYQPGDIVWVHDYHLMLLPAMLRQRRANMYVGFFLHSPFPSSELFRCLKTRKELLTGVLGANLVGFQTYSYARHFSSCCTRILGFESLASGVDAYGAHIAVDFHPIGIDALFVERQIFGVPEVEEAVKKIRDQYKGMKIIVGRDRLDTGRGVTQKLQAFELFLEHYPDWHGKVVLIQLTNSTSIDEGKEGTDSEIIKNISTHIEDINDIYGYDKWTPVLQFSKYLTKAEYFALLRAADLGLVTSVRDGMNTTALEFIIAQKENQNPLILSEFSGTAAKLPGATLINPWDLATVADEIQHALARSDAEKAAQHAKLYRTVVSESVSAWSGVYLDTLMVHLASFNRNLNTPPLSKVELLLQYRRSRRRLFMFDYDGTLTPIAREPNAAIPSDRVIRTVKKLAQDPKNNVWVISGRDQNFLSEWMGHIPELGLSAEHGSFIRQPLSEEWENLARKLDMSWQQEVLHIVNDYAERTQGSFVEKKEIAITWHYRRADPELGKFQATECRNVLEEAVATKYDLEIIAGKANLEVRPRLMNKGEIAKRLIDSYNEANSRDTSSGQTKPSFVMALGDDQTDEDMFRALNESGLPKETVFTCTVGASTKQTEANWHLLEPSDVIATIAFLNGRPSASDAATIEEVDAIMDRERNREK